MTSWVYLFSKFTGEALLLEALAIALLCAAYAAFYVLRKRRLGVAQPEVPGGVVKTYLNELIFDAEQLRAQLFGLLASSGIQVSERTARAAVEATAQAASTTVTVADPEAAAKLAALEGKMSEQARAMESIVADKARIEKELADARAKGAASGADPQVPKLMEKVQLLESRLAEYSVIEDDLANLKRLQQENAQLKAQLGGAPAAAPAKAAAPAPAPKKPEAAPVDLLATPTAPTDAFEGLVDQVEESLKPSEPAVAAPAAAPSTPEASAPKSDEDLVAEFEKMLSS